MSPRWWSRRDRLVVVAAALVPLAVCTLLAPFRRTLPNTVAALVLVVAVVAVAAYGHRIAGVVASISAGLWFDFFLEVPYHRFVIAGRRDVEVFVLLIVVGVAVSELAVRGRRSRLLAATDERYLDAIRTTGELAGPGHSRHELTGHVCAQLTDLLGLTACRFEADRFGGMPRLEPDGRLRGADGYWDVDQYGLPDRDSRSSPRRATRCAGGSCCAPGPVSCRSRPRASARSSSSTRPPPRCRCARSASERRV